MSKCVAAAATHNPHHYPQIETGSKRDVHGQCQDFFKGLFSLLVFPVSLNAGLRTQRPEAINPAKIEASSELPSSTEEAPNPGSPRIASHCVGVFDAIMNIQVNGTQSAAVTFGFSRKSCRKRKAMNPKVRRSANFEEAFTKNG